MCYGLLETVNFFNPQEQQKISNRFTIVAKHKKYSRTEYFLLLQSVNKSTTGWSTRRAASNTARCIDTNIRMLTLYRKELQYSQMNWSVAIFSAFVHCVQSVSVEVVVVTIYICKVLSTKTEIRLPKSTFIYSDN